ncbi:MAG: YceI family protein [Ilumatobacteraceae bacterium]
MSKKNGKPMKTSVKIIAGVVLVAILAVTAGPFVYINFIKDDAPKSVLDQGLPDRETTETTASIAGTTATTSAETTTTTTASTTAATAAAVGDGAGTTVAATGSGENYTLTMSDDVTVNYVGYRVVEVLFGQDTEGVGRTREVTGSLTLDGSQITAAEFTVDMTTLKSDETNRDRKFNGAIMNTKVFPTATFTITAPIDLGTVPADGIEVTASATGDLTIHGVTKSVTIEVQAQRNANIVDVLGSTDIVFADYGIDNPSVGGITTEDHGALEFLLSFTKT